MATFDDARYRILYRENEDIRQSSRRPFFQNCYVPHPAKRSRLLRKGLHKTYIPSFPLSFSNIIETRFQDFSITNMRAIEIKIAPGDLHQQPREKRIFHLWQSAIFSFNELLSFFSPIFHKVLFFVKSIGLLLLGNQQQGISLPNFVMQ